jgi:hypothetical protein
MSVSERNSKAVVTYNITNPDKRDYPITFEFLNESKNLKVYLRNDDGLIVLIFPTNYTVGLSSGLNNIWGTVVLHPSMVISNGNKLTIERVIPVDQTTTFNNQTIYSSVMDYTVDKLTAILQDRQDLNFTIHVPIDENVNESLLNVGTVNERKNKILGFGGYGQVTTVNPEYQIDRCLKIPDDESPIPDLILYKNLRSGNALAWDTDGKVIFISISDIIGIGPKIHELETEVVVAMTEAKIAMTEAKLAESTADTAKSTADTAKGTADAAQITANIARSAADSAQSTADAAQSTADTAKSTADAAQSTADTAQNTADVAQTTANTAQSTADTAQSAADVAQSTADTAQSAADAAQTTANTAQNAADAAQSTADVAENTAEQALNINEAVLGIANSKFGRMFLTPGFESSSFNICDFIKYDDRSIDPNIPAGAEIQTISLIPPPTGEVNELRHFFIMYKDPEIVYPFTDVYLNTARMFKEGKLIEEIEDTLSISLNLANYPNHDVDKLIVKTNSFNKEYLLPIQYEILGASTQTTFWIFGGMLTNYDEIAVMIPSTSTYPTHVYEYSFRELYHVVCCKDTDPTVPGGHVYIGPPGQLVALNTNSYKIGYAIPGGAARMFCFDVNTQGDYCIYEQMSGPNAAPNYVGNFYDHLPVGLNNLQVVYNVDISGEYAFYEDRYLVIGTYSCYVYMVDFYANTLENMMSTAVRVGENADPDAVLKFKCSGSSFFAWDTKHKNLIYEKSCGDFYSSKWTLFFDLDALDPRSVPFNKENIIDFDTNGGYICFIVDNNGTREIWHKVHEKFLVINLSTDVRGKSRYSKEERGKSAEESR